MFTSGLGIHYRLYLELIALLFTFDAFSGEHERGTLRLMLSNSVPRHTVLIGKFWGALLSISIPFILAVLVNLLLIATANTVHLPTEVWGRLGIISFSRFYTRVCFWR